MDDWWEGERRPAVLTPHAGEFARLRAGSGVDAGADGDLADDDDARVAAARDAAATWRQVVVLKGARTVIAAPGRRRSPSRRSRTRRSRPAGRATSWPGAIGSLLAQGLEPFAAARLGVYLHGAAGDGVRERFGDAGLLASDLPDGLAIARKRLAALAERRRAGKRLGFGRARAAGRAATPTRRRGRVDRVGRRDAPIEERLAAAGLPPLPRTAWLEIDLDALRGNLPPPRRSPAGQCRSSRSSRPTPTATAPSRSRGPSRRPGPTGSAWPRSTRRWRCGEAGDRGRRSCALPDPAGARPRGGRGRIDRRGRRSRTRSAGPLGGRARDRPDGAPRRSRSSSRSRPGSAAAASPRRRSRTRSRRHRGRPRAPGSPGSGRTSRRARTPDRTAAQLGRFEAASRATCAAAGLPTADRHVAASGGLLTDVVAVRRRPAGPRDLRPRPRRARRRGARRGRGGRGALRPVMSLHARPVRVADLPAGHGDQLRPDLHGRRRPSRIATLPLGYGDGSAGRSRTAPRPSSAALRVPARRQRRDGRDHGRRDRRPGPPVTHRRRVRAHRARRATSGSRVEDLARPRTTNTWEVVTAMAAPSAPGVPCRGRTGRSADAHRAERVTLARIELWNGDICDLEVDAIVNPGQPLAVDGDRRRRRDQARRRRRDRVRRRAPGARARSASPS